MKKGLRWIDILDSKSYEVSDKTPSNETLYLSVKSTNEPITARVFADGELMGELKDGGLELTFETVPHKIEIVPIGGSGLMSRAKLEVGTERTSWVPAEEDGGIFTVENYELYEKLNSGEWYTFSGEFPSGMTTGDMILGPDQEAYTIHPTRPKTFKPSEDIEKTLTIVLYED